MSTPTFVDLQGYPIGRRFVVKEAAVLRGGAVLAHYVFTTPMSWGAVSRDDRRLVTWLVRNHHGIAWEDGDVLYSRAKRLIIRALQNEEDCYDHAIVYVKGLEKRDWLQDMLEEDYYGDDYDDIKFYTDNLIVRNIKEDFENIESLNDLDDSITFRCRRHCKNCAVQNVFKLYNWWRNHQNNDV
ncbi:uncharacterized protein [Cardiocondyla obscurior]|uniref:uncharacterized protein isoform X2 n=1 Tax=Cardiocondyla obscurior TaxID=286306 RepID=UPI0039658A55